MSDNMIQIIIEALPIIIPIPIIVIISIISMKMNKYSFNKNYTKNIGFVVDEYYLYYYTSICVGKVCLNSVSLKTLAKEKCKLRNAVLKYQIKSDEFKEAVIKENIRNE